jgi:thiamine pyrophosphate-dependent acetolactate synthase large subunit-like protein
MWAVLCGFGCRGAAVELVQLAEHLQAPLTITDRAKDLLPYNQSVRIEGRSMVGSAAGSTAVTDADLLLTLGADYPYPEYLPTPRRRILSRMKKRPLLRRLRDCGKVSVMRRTCRHVSWLRKPCME